MESVDTLSFESDHRPVLRHDAEALEMPATLSGPRLSSQSRPLPQRHHAQSTARQACARVFRDGGLPIDALVEFGLLTTGDVASDQFHMQLDWAQAVRIITASLIASLRKSTTKLAL